MKVQNTGMQGKLHKYKMQSICPGSYSLASSYPLENLNMNQCLAAADGCVIISATLFSLPSTGEAGPVPCLGNFL